LGIDPAGSVLFGCRLYCVAHAENPHYMPTIPGVVRQVVSEVGGRVDGRPIGRDPWLIRGQSEVGMLVEFLKAPDRRLPVYVLSRQQGIDSTVISAAELTKELPGIAHVVILP